MNTRRNQLHSSFFCYVRHSLNRRTQCANAVYSVLENSRKRACVAEIVLSFCRAAIPSDRAKQRSRSAVGVLLLARVVRRFTTISAFKRAHARVLTVSMLAESSGGGKTNDDDDDNVTRAKVGAQRSSNKLWRNKRQTKQN